LAVVIGVDQVLAALGAEEVEPTVDPGGV